MKKHIVDNNIFVYEHGVDIQNRKIFMNASLDEDCGTVDTANADHISKSLHILTSSRELAKKPITIVINSPGGDIYDGFAIYDAIVHCPAPVTIEVYGRAMSMASIILQAADRRLLGPRATVMTHYGYIGHFGDADPEKRKNETIEEKRRSEMIRKILLDRIREKNPDFSISDYRKLMLEKYIPARQAIRLGLADAMIRKPSQRNTVRGGKKIVAKRVAKIRAVKKRRKSKK